MNRAFALALCLGLLALPAGAGHWRGIRASLQNVDHPALGVDISVTGFTNENGYREPFDESTLEELPSEEFPDARIGYAGAEAGGLPAISWGDGEILSSTYLPGVAGGTLPTYRGAFSHTYESPGAYTIRVHTSCCAPSAEEPSFAEIVIGNPAEESSSVLSNTVEVILGLATEPAVPVSRPALVLLAALLGGAAVWVVRRSG